VRPFYQELEKENRRLRRENQQLRARLAKLERENRALKKRLEQLEAELRRGRRQAAPLLPGREKVGSQTPRASPRPRTVQLPRATLGGGDPGDSRGSPPPLPELRRAPGGPDHPRADPDRPPGGEAPGDPVPHRVRLLSQLQEEGPGSPSRPGVGGWRGSWDMLGSPGGGPGRGPQRPAGDPLPQDLPAL